MGCRHPCPTASCGGLGPRVAAVTAIVSDLSCKLKITALVPGSGHELLLQDPLLEIVLGVEQQGERDGRSSQIRTSITSRISV